MQAVYTLAIALALTVAIEAAAMFVMHKNTRYMYYSLLCNLLTNPALNLSLWLLAEWLGAEVYWPAAALLELAVLFIEGGVYRYLTRMGWAKSLLTSFILNTCSFTVGLLLF